MADYDNLDDLPDFLLEKLEAERNDPKIQAHLARTRQETVVGDKFIPVTNIPESKEPVRQARRFKKDKESVEE